MKENYSLCLINDNRVTLVNDDTSTSWSVINDKVLLDVKVLIDEHNNLVIEGEPLVYEFASLPVDIE